MYEGLREDLAMASRCWELTGEVQTPAQTSHVPACVRSILNLIGSQCKDTIMWEKYDLLYLFLRLAASL